jgi:hypothetical protein
LKYALFKFGSFIGPGFMIAVAYSKLSSSSSSPDIPSGTNSHRLSKLILGTMQQMSQPELPTTSGCCSSSSWLICLPYSSRVLQSSLGLSVGVIWLRRVELFSRDGSTTSYMSLRRSPSLLQILLRYASPSSLVSFLQGGMALKGWNLHLYR